MNALCLVALFCLSVASFTTGSPVESSHETALASESDVELNSGDADEASMIAPAGIDDWFRRKWNNFQRSSLGQWMKTEKSYSIFDRWWRS